ncbi:MAG: serine/threonine protein phosphatase [Planctomycetia bacterium]|nr:serine/threonine protein phosphatase [Planctomycetia bacterium]
MKSKTFVIGDIHGGYKALKQCLERSNFDYYIDTLICLGDVADGWLEIAESFEELFKIKNLIYVRGNHDQWLKDWLAKGKTPNIWTMQGGQNTILSYKKHLELKEKHKKFLKNTPFYYLDKENRLFVHGGIDLTLPLESQDKMTLMWDRNIWNDRHSRQTIKPYKEIYVGHTSIYGYSKIPLPHTGVWYMDTGAGWEGVLSIMDIETKKFWQSDKVSDLYLNELSRLNHE